MCDNPLCSRTCTIFCLLIYLLTYGIFNNAVSVSDRIISNSWMIVYSNEFECTCEAAVAALSQRLNGDYEHNFLTEIRNESLAWPYVLWISMSTLYSNRAQYNVCAADIRAVLCVMPTCSKWAFRRLQYAKLLRGDLGLQTAVLRGLIICCPARLNRKSEHIVIFTSNQFKVFAGDTNL